MLLRGRASKKRQKSGVLLPLSSLPDKYGIGSLGDSAYIFADFLKSCNQSYWQLLPLVPLGKGNSPYSTTSSFAGEILYIDLDELMKNGLLSPDDINIPEFPENTDYKLVRRFKLPLLKKAAENFDIENKKFLEFRKENNYWLRDYALFMAIKECYCGAPFNTWDDGLKYRLPDALKEFEENHTEEILFYEITQFLFYSQFEKFKAYTSSIGLRLIGDIPFYVSFDCADVWAHPDCFKLGRDMTPILVAGVPPDIFSADGQLWGNPIYDWDYQKKSGYSWWKQRLSHTANMYDVIRIDHFRAFADYYAIPYGSKDAKNGNWERGVGKQFFDALAPILKSTHIIAEDLGNESPELDKLMKETGFPNMKILQFAFSSNLKNPFLPKNFKRNCVCYTGTHDNDTTLGWYNKATKHERLLFDKLVLSEPNASPVLSLISYGMKSKADTVIIPFPDYLELDSHARINTPGTEYGNWEWRFRSDTLTAELCDLIKELSKKRNM